MRDVKMRTDLLWLMIVLILAALSIATAYFQYKHAQSAFPEMTFVEYLFLFEKKKD